MKRGLHDFRNSVVPVTYEKKATRPGTRGDLGLFIGWVAFVGAVSAASALAIFILTTVVLDWDVEPKVIFWAAVAFGALTAVGNALWMTREAWKGLRILDVNETIKSAGALGHGAPRGTGGLITAQVTDGKSQYTLHDLCSSEERWKAFCYRALVMKEGLGSRIWDPFFGPAEGGGRQWTVVIRPKLLQAKMIVQKSEDSLAAGFILTERGKRAFGAWVENSEMVPLLEHIPDEDIDYVDG